MYVLTEEGAEKKSVNRIQPTSFSKTSITLAIFAIALIAVTVWVVFFFAAVTPLDPNSAFRLIFISGRVLDAVQRSGIFNDSKTFVDRPLLRDPQEVVLDFDGLPDRSEATLRAFVERNFDACGSDLTEWIPTDHTQHPQLLDKIVDPHYRLWAQKLNALWLTLGKQASPNVHTHPLRHTLMGGSRMMVPGGRFRESYYWDSYWVVRGLLLCDMPATAQLVVDDLLSLVREFGFVPNGLRRYYTTRSQPPFLTLMVQAVFEATGDTAWLTDAMPALEAEYAFYMSDARLVTVSAPDGLSFRLNRYWASRDADPRPESYVEDLATAETAASPPFNRSNHSVWSHVSAEAPY
jgi:alpha,alpha-trehalase